MSGKYDPIAAASETNHGPINTIAAVDLIVVTLLFSSIRYAMGRKRTARFELDDSAFGIALALAIMMSIISQRMVPQGIGRHIVELTPVQIEKFSKLQYATHFLSVLSMASSKASLVLMYRRLIRTVPTHGKLTLQLLLPVVLAYAVISLFLVAFQCPGPNSWAWTASTCSGRGTVHYAVSALNIVTDALLAIWIVPTIVGLQMAKSSKTAVIALLASRVIVCMFDGLKIMYIRRSVHSGDRTWPALGWAVVDQIVVHVSLSHAALPRAYVFLESLQTGLLATRLTVGGNLSSNQYNTKLKSNDECQSQILNSSKATRPGIFSFRSKTNRNSLGMMEDAHSSRTQLRLQPEHGTELSTFITAGDGDSTSSAGQSKGDVKGQSHMGWESNADSTVPKMLIKVEQTVDVRTGPPSCDSRPS